MIGMAIRNVANYTLFSKVPNLNDRAGGGGAGGFRTSFPGGTQISVQ
jgi:hypothetical protein